MPLYLCMTPKSFVDDNIKADIAKQLTNIHCEVTNAPSTFVHIFFVDVDAQELGFAKYHISGNIRAGRSDEQKRQLRERMRGALATLSGLDLSDVSMATTDVPASWVMEGGALLPEPGEEAAWLEKHGNHGLQ